MLLDHLDVPAADVAGVAVLRDQLQRDRSPPPPIHSSGAACDALRLVDRLVDRVVLAVEDDVVLGPHPVDHLDGLAERPPSGAGCRSTRSRTPSTRARTSPRRSRRTGGRGWRRRRWTRSSRTAPGCGSRCSRPSGRCSPAGCRGPARPSRVQALEDGLADRLRHRVEVVEQPDRVPGPASAARATAVIASHCSTGSSISTRSIRQPCGTNTPNFIDCSFGYDGRSPRR